MDLLAGDHDTVVDDLKRVIDFGRNIGLEINSSKCELYFCSTVDQHVVEKFTEICPDIQIISSNLSLLGASLTYSSCEVIFNMKFDELQTMFGRLADLNHHIAYFLIVSRFRNSLSFSECILYGNFRIYAESSTI